jgi:hypothetical protein
MSDAAIVSVRWLAGAPVSSRHRSHQSTPGRSSLRRSTSRRISAFCSGLASTGATGDVRGFGSARGSSTPNISSAGVAE